MMKQLIASISILLLIASLLGCRLGSALEQTAPEPVLLSEHVPGVHRETTTTPSGSALRYVVSVPANYDGGTPVPLVIALHYGGEVTPYYGGGLIDSLVGPGLEPLGAIVVAPDALGGGDWTTSQNEQAVTWLTRSILQSYAADPKRVAITGYSMGGEGAWYLGGRHQDLFTLALPIEGDPAGGSLEWTIPVYVIHSRDDQVIPIEPVERQVKKLRGAGSMVGLRIVDGLTHYETDRFVRPLREAVPWLLAVWSE